MTTQLAPAPVFRSWDNNGNPLSGGQLFSYQAGTSTPQATYVDSTQTTQNTNPVILNARGEASVWLDPTKVYKLVLQDPLGNLIWSQDQIVGGYVPVSNLATYITQSFIGQTLYPQTAAEVAANVTPVNFFYPPYDIRRYGGDPTGATNSDTALASAIAVCGLSGGVIRFPNGNYFFANQLNINLKISLVFQGEGTAQGGALPGTRWTYTGTASPWISAAGTGGCQFRDIQFFSNNGGFTGTQIQFGHTGGADCSSCVISDCMFEAAAAAGVIHLDLDKTIVFSASNCVFANGAPSVRGQATGGGSYSNNIVFRSCEWFNNVSAPITNGGSAWVFDGCNFENLVGLNGPAAAILSPNTSTIFDGLKVTGCWLGDMGSAGGTWFDITTEGADFSGNYISGNQTAGTAFIFRNCVGVSVESNFIIGFLNGFSFQTANSFNITIANNVINNVTNSYVGTAANVVLGTLITGPNFGLNAPAGHLNLGTNNAYRVNTDGSIEQWGFFTPAAHGTNTVNFGVTFPNACFNVQCTLSTVTANTATIYVSALSTTQFTATITDGTSTTDNFYWHAIGN